MLALVAKMEVLRPTLSSRREGEEVTPHSHELWEICATSQPGHKKRALHFCGALWG